MAALFAMKGTANGSDIYKALSLTLNRFGLKLNNLPVIVTDDAPAITGIHEGALALIRKNALFMCKTIHCHSNLGQRFNRELPGVQSRCHTRGKHTDTSHQHRRQWILGYYSPQARQSDTGILLASGKTVGYWDTTRLRQDSGILGYYSPQARQWDTGILLASGKTATREGGLFLDQSEMVCPSEGVAVVLRMVVSLFHYHPWYPICTEVVFPKGVQ
ncbi:general transcription factor II-I repeat domain-containing protein [Homalodisca vitripennis]|nr:general transcription factor II-I repeat domain-containing protein [Homalodisca vitripennis]